MASFFTFTAQAAEARAEERGEAIPHIELRVRRHERWGYGVQGPHQHEIGARHATAREAVAAIRALLCDQRLSASVHVYGPDMRYFRLIEIQRRL